MIPMPALPGADVKHIDWKRGCLNSGGSLVQAQVGPSKVSPTPMRHPSSAFSPWVPRGLSLPPIGPSRYLCQPPGPTLSSSSFEDPYVGEKGWNQWLSFSACGQEQTAPFCYLNSYVLTMLKQQNEAVHP